MKLAIGGDHAGFPMKGPVIELLEGWGHDVTDFGTHSPEPVDFSDIATTLAMLKPQTNKTTPQAYPSAVAQLKFPWALVLFSCLSFSAN